MYRFTSTLDHFRSHSEIVTSLRELLRVLRPGGQLLLTLDNPANPLVGLRNALPFGLLHRLRIVPYYVGATCGPRGLRRLLPQVGFEVLESQHRAALSAGVRRGDSRYARRTCWARDAKTLLRLISGFRAVGALAHALCDGLLCRRQGQKALRPDNEKLAHVIDLCQRPDGGQSPLYSAVLLPEGKEGSTCRCGPVRTDIARENRSLGRRPHCHPRDASNFSSCLSVRPRQETHTGY